MRRWTLLLALLAGAAACGGADEGAPDGRAEASRRELARGASALDERDPLAARLLSGSPAARHGGVRRVEVYDRSAEPARYLAYREEIVVDGEGRYSLVPLEPLTRVEPDWTTFQLLQRQRQGFVFRYRDFAVRDAGLFRRNWVLEDLGRDVVVAGRPCAEYEVHRRGGGRSYELAVDRGTALVLRARERNAAGELVAAVEYESFTPEPDTSVVVFHRPSNDERELDPEVDLAGELGSDVLVPRLAPPGFELSAAATVVDGEGRTWLKLTFLDGVEPVFFAHVLRGEADAASPGARAPRAGRVLVSRMGSVLAASGRIGEHEVVALGECPEDALLDLVESALP